MVALCIVMTRAEQNMPTTIAVAERRAAAPPESSTTSVSPAAMPSTNGSLSSTMKCRRNGTAMNTPSRPAVEQPEERLEGSQCKAELDDLALVEHVERGEQDAHKRGLRRGGPSRLDDVVLPAIERRPVRPKARVNPAAKMPRIK